MTRFIVTGGSGFVGNYLIKRLNSISPNCEIHNLDLKPSDLSLTNLINHEVDLTKLASISKFKFIKEDYIFHLAARIFTEDVPKRSLRSNWFESINVKGTSNLIEMMERDNASQIAFLSTDMVYGFPKETPIKVNHPLKPNGAYGLSKVKAEKLITSFGSKASNRSLIFRPRMIMGPGRMGILNKLFFLIKNNFPVPMIGTGKNRYQFISVYDCVEALIKFIEIKESHGIYNLGSENPPSVRNLLKFLIKEVNSSSLLFPTWGAPVKKILELMDVLNLTLIYPEQFLIADREYVLDTDFLNSDLNFSPKYKDEDMILEAYKNFLRVKN